MWPFEEAVYWHLFRKAILGTGTQYIRASVHGMKQGIIISANRQSDGLSYGAVLKALQGLEDKVAFSKVGHNTSEGTLHKINLPEEIPSCQEVMKQDRRAKATPGSYLQAKSRP